MIPAWWGIHKALSGHMGVCDIAASMGDFVDVDGHVKVCDLAARKSHAHRAKVLYAYSVPVSLVYAGVFAALPPYPPF